MGTTKDDWSQCRPLRRRLEQVSTSVLRCSAVNATAVGKPACSACSATSVLSVIMKLRIESCTVHTVVQKFLQSASTLPSVALKYPLTLSGEPRPLENKPLVYSGLTEVNREALGFFSNIIQTLYTCKSHVFYCTICESQRVLCS
jgi:hypothetical protein